MTRMLGQLCWHLHCQWKQSPRYVSSFVKRMKLLETLKDNQKECLNHLPTGKFLYFHKNRPLILKSDQYGKSASIPWMSYNDTHGLYACMLMFLVLEQQTVLLDVSDDGIARFALQLHPLRDDEKIKYVEKEFNASFEDLRTVMTMVSHEDLTLLSKASSLLNWNSKFLFCPTCSSKILRNNAGSHRYCPKCKAFHYPSLSPVGIVLVIDQDRCLLVRQPKHPRGMYTAIAGFSETGESLEETVHREVAEEVGLEVENVEYLKSQYWPYPASSLMVGCLATVKANQKVMVDKNELEDAKWFSANDVYSAAEIVKRDPQIVFAALAPEGTLLIPPPGPIAHNLITTWLQRIIH